MRAALLCICFTLLASCELINKSVDRSITFNSQVTKIKSILFCSYFEINSQCDSFVIILH